MLGGGTAWRPSDAWTFSLDILWTDWSDYRYVENNRNVNPLNNTASDLNDTYTVRVGVEFMKITDRFIFPFRGGVAYEPAPAIAGTGIQLSDCVNFEISYEYTWGDDVHVDYYFPTLARLEMQRHRVMVSIVYYFN